MGLEKAVEYALSEEGEHEPPTHFSVPEQQPPAVDEPSETLTPASKRSLCSSGEG
jgi:hypothetical protein